MIQFWRVATVNGRKSVAADDGVAIVLDLTIESAPGPGDQPFEGAFGRGRIFERDMAPAALAAGQHHLPIEQAVALEARHFQPLGFAPQKSELLAVDECDRLQVLVLRRLVCRAGIKRESGVAVWRN